MEIRCTNLETSTELMDERTCSKFWLVSFGIPRSISTWMAEDITFTDYKSKSKVCQQIQFTSQRFDANFRMTKRLINGHPLYFDADGGM